MASSIPMNAAMSGRSQDYKIWKVITASAVGTMIEWYDFYIFGSLATVISPLFYPKGNNTLALIAYLSTFAVGFVVRPFGALFFGRIGDLVGRKYAFLVTLSIMGGATAIIGMHIYVPPRSEEHTSELQSRVDLVCRLLLEKKK